MNLPAWFGRSTPLQAALRRGLSDGGNLARELAELEDAEVTSRADARAICHALRVVVERPPADPEGASSALHGLVGLFQDVEDPDSPACTVLREEGTPLLAGLVERALQENRLVPHEDLLFTLKILAMYGTREGADAVVAAARKPVSPEAYLWSVILEAFGEGHPHAVRVFTELADPLPPGFLAVSLLDAANRFVLEGGECRHPFDSAAGVDRLAGWLSDTHPDRSSYAVSATAALPFLNHPRKRELLALAMRHPEGAVALEAAWAAARGGDDAGIERLAAACLDVTLSARARKYLEELQRPDAVPEAAIDPGFAARAEFAQWLAHPNELGRAPDQLEIIDHRELRWPPAFEPVPVWLLRYQARATSELDEDDTGVGMVGTVTWCFFSHDLDQRPPEDAYALHCCWELEPERLKFLEVDGECTEYDALLAHWPGPPLAAPQIEHVVEVSPELQLPARLLAVAAAGCEGVSGWAVLDGPDSRWYPADDFPANERGERVLRIHLGRRLLDLDEPASRKAHLKPPAPSSPAGFLAAYDRVLARFEAVSLDRADEVERLWQLLERHATRHVLTLGETAGPGPDDRVLRVFERLLAAARRAAPTLGDQAFQALSAPGLHFEAAVDALVAGGRADDIAPLVTFFAPHWDHNLGHGLLGTAAFKAGDHDTAEGFFLKLKAGLEDWHRCEEMPLLARIWIARSRRDEARALLLECLEGVRRAGRQATGPDRDLHEEWFQHQRRAFLDLFPDHAAELERRGIPSTLLPPPRRSPA